MGYSSDLKSRLKEHESGQAHQTRSALSVKLVYYSAFTSKKKALSFEKYLKTPSGFAFRNKRHI